MGAEASALAKELSEELDKHKGKPDENQISRNGWDPEDKSPNITINDEKTKAVRNDADGSVDAVRGVMTYRRGVHLLEFEWTPGQNKYVAIGVATSAAPLTGEGDVQLLGSTDQSVGWNLVTRQIHFNGCETGKFPKDIANDYVVPDRVIMILNMNEGSLSFKADGDRIGVAMEGLKHLGEKLYIAAAMNKPWETVKVRYLGNADALQKKLELKPPDDLYFHAMCGEQAFLGNDNYTAARKNPSEKVCDATVLTHRPLTEGELFSVRLDKRMEAYSSSWSVGLTTVDPFEMVFLRDMSKCEQGKVWIFSGKKVYYQRQRIEETNCDLDALGVGDVVGLKIENGRIGLYINGSHHTSIKMSCDEPVYGFVDLFGRARQVTIMNKSSENISSEASLVGTLEMPTTEDEYQVCLVQLIETLKEHNKATIPSVTQALVLHMEQPFEQMKLDSFRTRSAECLASIEGSAKVIQEYLVFLWEALENEQEIAKSYLHLLACCDIYSGKSMTLCQQFGEVGLVKTGIHVLHRIKKDKVETSRFCKLMLTYWLRILENCARVTDNQRIYRQIKYMERSQQFIDRYPDELEIVVPILMTMCFLVDDDKPPIITAISAKHMLMVLRKAVERTRSDGSHRYDWWYAHELAICIGMLGQNEDNLKKITEEDGIFESLTKMFKFDEDKDKECAANALWSLTAEFNFMRLFKMPGFLEQVKRLVTDGSDSVQMAARRLLRKLENLKEKKGNSQSLNCDYFATCCKFMKTLKVTDAYLDSKFDKCYCIECHSMRGDQAYYKHGQPPKTHAVPVGWARFGLRVPANALANKAHTDWHTAYHGTKTDQVLKILSVGYLVPAGRETVSEVDAKEGSKLFSDDCVPKELNTEEVFFSPSIRYAGSDAYARPSKFTLNDPPGKTSNYTARVAFQILVKPGSYTVGKESVGATQVIDPGFNNQELEWSTTQDGATILNAILIKLDKI